VPDDQPERRPPGDALCGQQVQVQPRRDQRRRGIVAASDGLTDSDLTVIEHCLALRGQLIVPVSELARRVQRLLDELCVDLGYCLPPVARDRLCREPSLDPNAFVDAVFRTEGLDPHPSGRLRRQVKDKVTKPYAGYRECVPQRGHLSTIAARRGWQPGTSAIAERVALALRLQPERL